MKPNSYFQKCALLLVLLGMSLGAAADNLKVAVGLALPPYVIQEDNSGMELDIVREALKLSGHTVEPVYLPFARVSKSLEDKKVDAALTVTEASGIANVHYSEPHITYQNVAVSLAKNSFAIQSVDDLGSHSVIAFQNAVKYLGDTFANMAKTNKRYSEKAKQSNQITMLFGGRVETVVMDINIFKYFRASETKLDTSSDVNIHEIFPPTHYKVGFLKAAYRDQFNEGLATLKSSGKYDEIIKGYVN